MFSNHGVKSITLFVFSVLALLLLSFFEKALSGLSISAERTFSIVLLVLPGLAGIVLGAMGVVKNESRRWLAVTGIILNGLFAAFMTFVSLFSG